MEFHWVKEAQRQSVHSRRCRYAFGDRSRLKSGCINKILCSYIRMSWIFNLVSEVPCVAWLATFIILNVSFRLYFQPSTFFCFSAQWRRFCLRPPLLSCGFLSRPWGHFLWSRGLQESWEALYNSNGPHCKNEKRDKHKETHSEDIRE